jgi:hypothetical protein
MEMLGRSGALRSHGLHHAPTTHAWRSPAMRVKRQLVLCSDDGHEATVTDVVTLK